MAKELYDIIATWTNMAFTLTLSMIIWWFLMELFIDFKDKEKKIYMLIIKYSFIVSVVLFILWNVIKVSIK